MISNADRVGSLYADDPDLAFGFVRRGVYDVRHGRSFQLLTALLACVDGLIAEDPAAAVIQAERACGLVSLAAMPATRGRPLRFGPELKVLAGSVWGSALTMAGERSLAAKTLMKVYSAAADPALVAGVLTRRAVLSYESGKYRDAVSLASRALKSFPAVSSWTSPYTSVETTRVVRAGASIGRYLSGEVRGKDLLADACRDAQLAQSSGYPGVATNATSMLLYAVSLQCFGGKGCDVLDASLSLSSFPSGSARWAKCRWIEGLVHFCHGSDLRGEFLLREAREALIELSLSQEVLHLTLDLQWWLLASGRVRAAQIESSVLMDLCQSGRLRLLVTSWSDAVGSGALTLELVSMVFSELRGVQCVGLPGSGF